MQTETVDNPLWRQSPGSSIALVRRIDWRLALLVLLALVAGMLAYQRPAKATLNVGWLGDQLFLPTSEGLGQADLDAGRWFSDELTTSVSSQRSRWTRQQASITLPDLGAGSATTLVIVAQGWPADAGAVVAQPTVSVLANGSSVGTFTAKPDWAEYQFTLPAALLKTGDLQLLLITDATLVSPNDVRPIGVRVAQIRLAADAPQGLVLTPLRPLALLTLIGALGYLALGRALRRPNLALALAVLVVLAVALGLAFVRIWAAALLPWLTSAALLALALACWHPLARLLVRLVDRFTNRPLDAGLIAALVVGLSYLVWTSILALVQGTFGPPLGLLLLAALALLSMRVPPAVRAAQGIVRWLATRRGALTMLTLFLVLWLGYELMLIATLPGAGHADYSDNAVVARNLVRGRGWVVDYVTQFYRLYPSLTRPQETWPLLQPVWIAPFFVLFGAVDWAAKMPNLIATGMLGVLIYRFGARLWDRRIGLTAAILLVTSNLFVLLVINVTSDLIFVLLAFAVVSQMYAWGQGSRVRGQGSGGKVQWRTNSSALQRREVVLLGVLTGLMFLQKPGNGVFVAAGCGVWLLVQWFFDGRKTKDERRKTRDGQSTIAALALWTIITVAIFSPFLIRNYALSQQNNHIYGSLVYSTESRDAWVWGYAPDTDYIYKLYTPEGGLSETEGLPNRSWILRWGFDRTLAKIGQQVESVRDYLAPVWAGLPNNWSEILSGREEKRLFFTVGAWLSTLGLLIGLWHNRALIGLLALAFVPYTLFLLVYWHADEERYFVALMPWLTLFAALTIWRLFDRLARLANGKLAPFALALTLVLCGSVVIPSLVTVQEKIAQWHYADGDRDAYAWLKTSTPAGAAVMTRVPWQLNWHSERPALMIPWTTDRKRFFQLARHYNIRYLMMDVAQRPDTSEVQPFLERLVSNPANRFMPVYASPNYGKGVTYIYEFPIDYGNVPELRP